MGIIQSLKCRECAAEYEPRFIYVCEDCFGPLDVIYNLPSGIKKDIFTSRSEKTYWRYFELLPVTDRNNIIDLNAGFTPLQYADRLGKEIGGLKHLFIKNDSVNPTFSFKDRPARVAVSKAKEIGLNAVGCASTGNLASATAAHAAKAKLPCYIFAPSDIEHVKIAQALSYGAEFVAVEGTYDDANRVASIIGDSKGIGVVNINMRPYYVQGSKRLGFIDSIRNLRITAAQPHGCSPVVDAFKRKSDNVIPVERPETIAKSLAIGDPGDGLYVLKKLRQYNGIAEEATDEEMIYAIP